MANAVKKAIVTTMVEGILTDLMVQTSADNVILEGNMTLSEKLAEMIGSLNGKASTESVNQAVSKAIDDLIDGAPETYNTLKEIADYISSHEDVVTALNNAIGGKVDKEDGKGLSANDFTDALKAKLENLETHNHDNKSVLDGITAKKVAEWNGKSTVTISAEKPENMQNSDIWIQTISN